MSITLSEYVSVFAKKLTTLAKDEITLLLGVGDEIESLQTRLQRILPVLADADMRRLQDESIKTWVRQLRDVVYGAEDIIEGYMSEGKKLRRAISSPLSFCNHYIFRRRNTGNKIISLNKTLDAILKDMAILNLRSTSSVEQATTRGISRKTSSLVEPHLVGKEIEDDTNMLVDLLTSNENQRKQLQKISVFAIVGMGGIGKTTLAQKIFNNDKLRAKFSHLPPVWVCVSQDFSEAELLRAIIMRAGGIPGKAKEKEDLEPMLYDIVNGKKVFLVLDDVWDAQVWENLLYRPLQSVSVGSRILVTTRHESVATSMRAMHFHRVQQLSDVDGWSLLCNMVFQDGVDEQDLKNSLRDVGMRIVKKCDGLPLAVKAIAGVLRNKGRRQCDWEEVLQNPAWSLTELPEGVMGALYLSFNELPSHLKQCFLYFALFPEDAEFRRAHMVRLWIAEGFVEERENKSMENIGKEYWKELVHRSLLQPQDEWYDTSRGKIHDLLHSLARYLASDECFCCDLVESNGKTMPCSSWMAMQPRRVNIRNGEAIAEVIRKHASLRTLLLPFHRNLTKDAPQKFKYLRILSLINSCIETLPDSIGALALLRYLDISESAIREIPNSIGNLINLQFLIMSGCKNLRKLPKSITNLQNLRCLDLSSMEILNLPAGINKLQNLVTLYGFLVTSSNINHGDRKVIPHRSRESYCNMGELGSLSQLSFLSVYRLENASSGAVTEAAALRAMTNLAYLELHCTTCRPNVDPRECYGQEKIEKIGAILEVLCPPPSLEFLIIGGFFGLDYPSWMKQMPSSFLPNLRRLELNNCLLCEKLPPLGLLPQLDCLWIEGVPSVKSIGPELFGVCNKDGQLSCPRSSFPRLEILHLEKMPNLEDWYWLNEDDQVITLLPSLHTLAIEGCPKLRSLPCSLLRHRTALKYLWIKGACSLTEINNILHVKELTLIDNPCIVRVSNLPSLKQLWVEDCKELKDVDSLDELQLLDVRDSAMGSLPDWLLHVGTRELKFCMLQRLVIQGNSKLISRCIVGGPDWHKMWKVPCVDCYCYDQQAYYIRYSKSPFSFDINMSQG